MSGTPRYCIRRTEELWAVPVSVVTVECRVVRLRPVSTARRGRKAYCTPSDTRADCECTLSEVLAWLRFSIRSEIPPGSVAEDVGRP